MRRAPGAMVTDKVRLVAQLGAGGMGEVWEAEHVSLGNRVAVKFIREELSEHKEELLRRLEREAKVVAKLRSPHAVRIFDHGVVGDDSAYIIMELLQGQSLAQRLKRHGTLDLRQVAQLVGQVASVLAEAHDYGVVHRDIKPDNIFVVQSEQLFVKVLDFGIAKVQALPQTTNATATNVMMGTPRYMSPEQVVSAKHVDASADLWALSVVAYESLTGVVPFDGETLGAVVLAINSGKFVAPSRVSAESVPAALDAWFRRAFHTKRAKRFGDARALAETFEIATEPGQAGRRRPRRSASQAPGPARGKKVAAGARDGKRAEQARPRRDARGQAQEQAQAQARRGKSTLVMASPKPKRGAASSQAAARSQAEAAAMAVAPTTPAQLRPDLQLSDLRLSDLQLDLPGKQGSASGKQRTSGKQGASGKHGAARKKDASRQKGASRKKDSSSKRRRSAAEADAQPTKRSAVSPSERPPPERSKHPSYAPRPAATLSVSPPARTRVDSPSAGSSGEQVRVGRIYREMVAVACVAMAAMALAYALGPGPRAALVTQLGSGVLYVFPLGAVLALGAGAKVWDRAHGAWPLRIGGAGLLALGVCLAIASAGVLSSAFDTLSDPMLPAAAGLAAVVALGGLAAHGVLGALEELFRKPPQFTVALLMLGLSVAGLAAAYQLVRGPVVQLIAPAPPAPSSAI